LYLLRKLGQVATQPAQNSGEVAVCPLFLVGATFQAENVASKSGNVASNVASEMPYLRAFLADATFFDATFSKKFP